MKRIYKIFALILAFLLTLPHFPALTADGAEIGENIPTIFIGNDAWYKYKIQPLVTRDDDHLIPISVFSAFDDFSVNETEAYNSILIVSEDGSFLSINTKNGRYMTHTGEMGDIGTELIDKEYYISARTAASLLGLGYEEAFFYDKNVIRLYTTEALQALEILIDAYIGSYALLPGAIGSGAGTARRKSTFSTVVDISETPTESIRTVLEAAELIDATMTFAFDDKFIANQKNLPLLADIAAAGHSFAISLVPHSEKSSKERIDKCNSLLSLVFKKQTKLILTEGQYIDFPAEGYIILSSLQRVSDINIGSFNLGNNKTIFLDNTEMINISKFVAIADSASKNGKSVTALNQLTGN